jgi:probable F420-dependent oxidoreductase
MSNVRQAPIKPFRFGVQVSTAPDGPAWTELARRVESLGYSSFTMPDHFSEQLAPMPALMAAAGATSTLRVGALVWDNDYKHPVVFAKEIATLDVLSGGRVELGIGAGWMKTDYDQSGIAYDTPGVRIERMIEGVAVIRGALGPGPFSFSGRHYTITGYDGLPKPVQSPCPPLLIGAGGKRMLTYAAREADIVGINPVLTAGAVGPEAIASMAAEVVDDKVRLVNDAAGSRLADIEFNVRAYLVNISDDHRRTIDGLASGMGVSADLIANSPFALIGSPAKLVEDLLARRERWGFSYVIVGADDVDTFAPVVAQLAGK